MEPVAVAVVILCAVLAASRGCARDAAAVDGAPAALDPGCARHTASLYATAPG